MLTFSLAPFFVTGRDEPLPGFLTLSIFGSYDQGSIES